MEDEKEKSGITDRELGYFMGKVNSQLAQILEILREQKKAQEESNRNASLRDIEIANSKKDLEDLDRRVGVLEAWKDDSPEKEEIITFQWIREKLQVPIVVAVIIFFLTTVLPAVLLAIQLLGK